MIYQIKVEGCLDPNWSDWFNEMEITNETKTDSHSITTLEGTVGDQATLRGILNHLWDLNLTILSVNRVEPKLHSSG